MKSIVQILYIISKVFVHKEFTLGVKLFVIGFAIGESLVPNSEEKDCSIVERLESNLKTFISCGDVASLIKKL